MRFVSEEDLKQQFWRMYKGRSSILASSFEHQARHGGVDLLTVERVANREGKGDRIEFCSFEYKLADIEKAFAQANINSQFCHKNFIVVPIEKKKVIEDRYGEYLKRYPSIGCIGVYHPDDGGRWDMFHKARAKRDEELTLNQNVIKLCLLNTKSL